MDCASPPCPGTVRDDLCPVCGLKQGPSPEGVKVDGPLHVTRRSKDGTEQAIVGLSVTVGDRVVTVHLRRDKETRTFEVNGLVSIDPV
jgi:hypothetical protein